MMRARLRAFFSRVSRKALGIGAILLVVFIWVASAELIQFIYASSVSPAPFFITYFNTSLFTVYLLGFLIRPSWWGERGPPRCFVWMTPCLSPLPSERVSLINASKKDDGEPEEEPLEQFTVSKVAWIALGFCPLWFGANYFYNLSLTKTSAASATILSTTSSLFTFCLGALLKLERATIWKVVGILVTLLGVALVSLSDTDQASSNNIVGDIFALIGAICYALYAIYLKFRIPDERSLHMPMLFGFVGLFNVLLFWPLGFVLSYTLVEPWHWPSGAALGYLFLNGFVGTVISDYLWVLGVVLASPVIATVGLSLTTPLQMVADAVIHHKRFGALYVIGALLTVVGFFFVSISADTLRRLYTCGRSSQQQAEQAEEPTPP